MYAGVASLGKAWTKIVAADPRLSTRTSEDVRDHYRRCDQKPKNGLLQSQAQLQHQQQQTQQGAASDALAGTAAAGCSMPPNVAALRGLLLRLPVTIDREHRPAVASSLDHHGVPFGGEGACAPSAAAALRAALSATGGGVTALDLLGGGATATALLPSPHAFAPLVTSSVAAGRVMLPPPPPPLPGEISTAVAAAVAAATASSETAKTGGAAQQRRGAPTPATATKEAAPAAASGRQSSPAKNKRKAKAN